MVVQYYPVKKRCLKKGTNQNTKIVHYSDYKTKYKFKRCEWSMATDIVLLLNAVECNEIASVMHVTEAQ